MKKLSICFSLIFILLSTTLLSGCVGAFATGAVAGATATTIVYDRRSLAVIRDDQNIDYEIHNTLYAPHAPTRDSHLLVASFNYDVLLIGQAQTAKLRGYAYQVAKKQPKVRHVYNEITIAPPTSNLTRASDAWITTKIKTKMLSAMGLQSSQIKVVTENSVVYLMGEVTHHQAKIATDIARRVDGVQRVVRIFHYMK